jgi:mono/diheme cytochrome c family protein
VRYTKVATMSYLMAAGLLAAGLLFATWRSRGGALVLGPAGTEGDVGERVFVENCASCHATPREVAIDSGVDRDWRPIADLLLFGRASIGTPSRATREHPTFTEMSDGQLAAVLDYVRAAAGSGRSEARARITPDEIASRRSQSPK